MLDAPHVAGEETRRAIHAQPEWLRAVRTDRRLPAGRILHTGCGTSFHAAQTGGWAEQALDLGLRPPGADPPGAVSHGGAQPPPAEGAAAFAGPSWPVPPNPGGPPREPPAKAVGTTP